MPFGNVYEEVVLKNGGKIAFWAKNAKVVSKYINAHKLEELSNHHLSTGIVLKEANLSKKVQENRKELKNGGMRVPHLHYDGKIFLLDELQWKEFSKTIIGEFQQKLAKANSINYEQLMELSGAMESIV